MQIFNAWLTQIRREFTGYGFGRFQKDLLAAMTVAAVALPLSLAFGVASGVEAAAGLVTAILAGTLIGFLGGAPQQISGPTGAMTALTIVFAVRFGVPSLWVIGFLAGFMLLLAGIFRLGRLITFIPSPVIAGFSSGIALVIALGQIDNILGIKTPPATSIFAKLSYYFREAIAPSGLAIAITLLVVVIMLAWGQLPFSQQVPGSLMGIVVATIVVAALGWQIPLIGTIPRSILLEQRLRWGAVPLQAARQLLLPAFSVAVLGTMQAVMVGAVGTRATGNRSDTTVELVGQGIANMIMPLLGGIPGTSEIARSSINIKSGGTTRMAPILHGLILLLVVLVLAPIIGRIPLAALSGVILVTTWRMNDWQAIRFYFGKRLKHAIAAFLLTLISIVLLDLNQAILLGILISVLIFFAQLSDVQIEREGDSAESTSPIIYHINGPLFFAAARQLMAQIEAQDDASSNITLSLRGVSLLDVTALEVLRELQQRQQSGGGSLQLVNLQPRVKTLLVRGNLLS